MDTQYDYIIVGSGAGGGPLAANLAKHGLKVLLLEAGGDPCSEDETGRLMYKVPIFHGASTEYKPCAWNYYIRHYTDDVQQAKDSKVVKVNGRDTIWYPRAGTLGGCTAHNAMITVIPQDSDWNHIAAITGDSSWSAEHMRTYFARLENCKYVPAPDTVLGASRDILSSVAELLKGHENWRDWSHGHGFKGWLPTSEAEPKLALKDPELLTLLLGAVKAALLTHPGDPVQRTLTRFDPNDSRNATRSPDGLAFTPLAVENGKRTGPREYLLRVAKASEQNLTIQKHALATRILFDGKKAIGVAYIDKAHTYRADPEAGANGSMPDVKEVYAGREVIICGGAFNTPQLLMLSGIGRKEELQKFNIPAVADLPGVGQNLQDRYEVGVISQLKRNLALLEGATFALPDGDNRDAYMTQRQQHGSGVYASNGAVVGLIKRSKKELPDPDLYIFGLPGFFAGYKPGYSKLFEYHHNRFTWAILKARTNNTGRVRLASADPRDLPDINFQYFGDGQRQSDPDLDAVENGVEFVRGMNKRLRELGIIEQEEVPGPSYQTSEQLRQFIRNEAWGHHASCTAKIGADNDPLAVLDSRFRVRNTEGLRVVDASIFPKIPGYFIVTAIYMASEKAADVIMADAK